MTQQQQEKSSKWGSASEALRHVATDRLSMSIKMKEIKFSPSGIFADMKSKKSVGVNFKKNLDTPTGLPIFSSKL